jgi:plastocyanin
MIIVGLAIGALSVGLIFVPQTPRLNQASQSASSLPAVLPVMNQTTTTRQIWETWYISPSSHQDRFEPSFITVNQGDTVQLTLIDNDTVAHDLAIGPPYNIMINATVPGLVNDMTGEHFTTAATNNSPGVTVTGTPGNVSATYSFVAKYAGIYEFVCTYHAEVGMIGYLTVLPNAAYAEKVPAGHASMTAGVNVTIPAGAASNTKVQGYAPDEITVPVGNTVTWTNQDSAPHTVTANDASFDSGNLAPKQAYSFSFTNAGTYNYHCVYHPWMTGSVVVK